MPKRSNNSHFKINIAKDNFSHNNPYSEEELERRVFNGRKTIWTVAFNLFLDNPNIGIGKRNFSKNYNEHIKNNLDNYTREYNLTKDEIPFDTIVRDPHNLVLGLLCDYGVFFTLFVLLTFFLAFTFVFRFNFYLTFLFFCFFLNGITNYHIYRPVLETVFAFSLILIFSQNRGFSFFNKIEFHKIFLKMKNLEQ